jgi:hypothetical protein
MWTNDTVVKQAVDCFGAEDNFRQTRQLLTTGAGIFGFTAAMVLG